MKSGKGWCLRDGSWYTVGDGRAGARVMGWVWGGDDGDEWWGVTGYREWEGVVVTEMGRWTGPCMGKEGEEDKCFDEEECDGIKVGRGRWRIKRRRGRNRWGGGERNNMRKNNNRRRGKKKDREETNERDKGQKEDVEHVTKAEGKGWIGVRKKKEEE